MTVHQVYLQHCVNCRAGSTRIQQTLVVLMSAPQRLTLKGMVTLDYSLSAATLRCYEPAAPATRADTAAAAVVPHTCHPQYAAQHWMHVAESVYLSVWLAVNLLLMPKDHVSTRADAEMLMTQHSCFAQAAQQFCNTFDAGLLMIRHQTRVWTCTSCCATPAWNKSGVQSQQSNSVESRRHPHSQTACWLTLPQFQDPGKMMGVSQGSRLLAHSLSLALSTPQIKAMPCSKLAGKLATGLCLQETLGVTMQTQPPVSHNLLPQSSVHSRPRLTHNINLQKQQNLPEGLFTRRCPKVMQTAAASLVLTVHSLHQLPNLRPSSPQRCASQGAVPMAVGGVMLVRCPLCQRSCLPCHLACPCLHLATYLSHKPSSSHSGSHISSHHHSCTHSGHSCRHSGHSCRQGCSHSPSLSCRNIPKHSCSHSCTHSCSQVVA